MEEKITEKLLKLISERDRTKEEYCDLLNTMSKHIEMFKIDHHMINALMNYSHEMDVLNREIKLLKELKKGV